MITLSEARQRANVYNGYIRKTTASGEFACGLIEWSAKERRKAEYFTDDVEDAYLTVAAMRRQAANTKVLS